MSTHDTGPVVSLRGITRRFATVVANDRVDFALHPGEVHALVGENGAGKTTLMRVLAGFLPADSGEITVEGVAQSRWDSRRARAVGVGMVHQHLMLVDALTVLENLLLGKGERGFGLDVKGARRGLVELGRDFDLPLNPNDVVGELDGPRRQWVAIARALAAQARVLILDEPTAFIGPRETARLLRFVRQQAGRGCAVAFISHKLPEVTQVADRITVLRRGRVVGRFSAGQASEAQLARLMVGELTGEAKTPAEPEARWAGGPTVLELRQVSLPHGRLRGVTLSVRAGEVVGIAGVAGNGQAELVELLLGLGPPFAGEVVLGGAQYRGRVDRARRRELVAHIPGEARRRGLVAAMTVAENCLLGHEHRPGISRAGWLFRPSVEGLAREVTSDAGLEVGLAARAGVLSGGMGQRLVVARALAKPHELLLAEQPTAGLDVSGAAWIHRAVRREAASGRGVLLVSYDVEELLATSDRVAVLYDGGLAGPLRRDELSTGQLADLMAGVGVEHVVG